MKLDWNKLTSAERDRAVAEAFGVAPEAWCARHVDKNVGGDVSGPYPSETACLRWIEEEKWLKPFPIHKPYSTSVDACLELAEKQPNVVIGLDRSFFIPTGFRWEVYIGDDAEDGQSDSPYTSLSEAICIALLRFKGIEVSI